MTPHHAPARDLLVAVEGDVPEGIARAFWMSLGTLAAELLDDEDRVGEDLGTPEEAAA